MKYAPGLMVGQLSGSVGSTTASHGPYGAYFRSRVIPVNPNSTSQQGVRAVFGGLSQRWRTITESQRDAWKSLALMLPRVDSLGQQYFLRGNALYVATNALRDAVNNPVIDAAPALDSPPVLATIALTTTIAIGGTMEIAYTSTGGVAGNDMIIKATAPRSAGRDFISRGELKQIQVVAGNVATPIDIQAAYEAVFGIGWLAQSGMEIAVELFPVSANGLPGVGIADQSVIV